MHGCINFESHVFADIRKVEVNEDEGLCMWRFSDVEKDSESKTKRESDGTDKFDSIMGLWGKLRTKVWY